MIKHSRDINKQYVSVQTRNNDICCLNFFQAQQPFDSRGLLTDRWYHVFLTHTDVNDHSARIGVTIVSTLFSSAVVDFLVRNNSYKSIAIEILHNSGLEPIPFTGPLPEIEPTPHSLVWVSNSTP